MGEVVKAEPVAKGEPLWKTHGVDASAPKAPGVDDTRQQWIVVGGVDKGGILVRRHKAKNSPELGRLSHGALVFQIDVVGDRLHYEMIEGEGPDFGWVSTNVQGTDLVERL